jgi:hypothetical protein
MVRFWRPTIYSAITAVLMVAIALAYLSASGPMSVTIVVATTFGCLPLRHRSRSAQGNNFF